MKKMLRIKTKSRISGNWLKKVLIMKLTLFLICVNFFVVLGSSYSQNTKFTLNGKDVKLEDVLEEIKENSEFRFFYNNTLVDLEKRVNYNVENATVSELLDIILDKAGLKYEIVDKTIILSPKEKEPVKEPIEQQPQKKTITGKVTDENGESLPGVSIVVKGTTIGTTTDATGNYSLDIPEDANILVFSFVGMLTQEIPIAGQQQINVVLEESSVGIGEVVAVGIRASQMRALAIKRMSPVFLDAITAEDAGKFPDRNISEALQRVPGVAIQRTRGQGDFVSIRGLGPEFVRGSINGRTLVSATESFNPVLSGGVGASTGRATNFDVLPSEIIESVEVQKSNAAEHVEGGLAGTVNIVTSKPLKVGNKIGITARGSYYEFADEMNPSLSGFASMVNDSKTLGALVSVTYSDRKIREDATRTYAYFPNSMFGDPTTFDTNLDGTADEGINDPYFPFSTSLDNFNEQRKRLTVNGTFQWSPSKNTNVTMDASYSKRDLAYLDRQSILEFPPSFGRLTEENGYTINPDGSVQYPLGMTVDASNTAITFGSEGYVGSTIVNATDQQTSKDNLLVGGINLTQKAGDWNLNFDANVSTTKSDFTLERGSLRTGTMDGGFPTVYQVNLSNGILEAAPTVTDFSGNVVDVSKADNYVTHNFDLRTTEISDMEFAMKADAEKSLDNSFFSSIKFGARYRTRTRENEQKEFFGQLPFTDGSDAELLRLSASGVATTNMQNNFMNGDYANVFDVSQLVFVSDAGDWRKAHEDAGGTFPFLLDPNNTYEIKENTMAGYVQLNIDGNLWELPIVGNVGLRLVNTNIETNGSAQELGQVSVPGSQLKYSEFIGSPIPYSESENYLKLLPSINLKIKAAENIYIRTAYSKSITRPQFNDLAGVSINFTQNIINKAGNPGLKPYESTNYDLGMEWYTGNAGFFGISFFYKKLSNFVTNTTRANESFIGNVWTSFLTRENQGKGKISGTEISYHQPFSFLPGIWKGFGVMSNFTFSNGEQSLNDGSPIAFPGVSEFSYNSALYFDHKGIFQARLAYTYRDQFLLLANDVFGQEQWIDDYGQLDASASYKISDVFTIFGEVVNLSNSRNKLFSTNLSSPAFNNERPISVEHVGQQWGFGIRAIF